MFSQLIEFNITDTIFSQSLQDKDTRQISKKKVNRLIKKRKLYITDTLKNSSIYFANYFNKTFQKVIMLKNEKGFQLIEVLKEIGNKHSITDTIDITGDGNNELMIYWIKSYSYDNTFSVGTGSKYGVEIIDLKNKKFIITALLANCSRGFNMCRGESSSGCSQNYKLTFENNIIHLENINERTKPIIFHYQYQKDYLVRKK